MKESPKGRDTTFSNTKHEIRETPQLAMVGEEEGPSLGRKKKKENGKAFYSQRTLNGNGFVILNIAGD